MIKVTGHLIPPKHKDTNPANDIMNGLLAIEGHFIIRFS
jgi:hypothetical protein